MSGSNDNQIIPDMPSKEILAMLGSIDISWAQADVLASAALYGALKIEDPIEFAHLIGQLDVRAKLGKLAKILLHRRDARHKTVRALAKQIDDIKGFRNAITHGYYLGHSNQGEYA